jgi:hypothetical protein
MLQELTPEMCLKNANVDDRSGSNNNKNITDYVHEGVLREWM